MILLQLKLDEQADGVHIDGSYLSRNPDKFYATKKELEVAEGIFEMIREMLLASSGKVVFYEDPKEKAVILPYAK